MPTSAITESLSDERVVNSGTTPERVLGMDLGAAQPPMLKQCEAKRAKSWVGWWSSDVGTWADEAERLLKTGVEGKSFSEIQSSSTSKLVISQVFQVGIFIRNTNKTGNKLINAKK
jgi:hypothetical protein